MANDPKIITDFVEQFSKSLLTAFRDVYFAGQQAGDPKLMQALQDDLRGVMAKLEDLRVSQPAKGTAEGTSSAKGFAFAMVNPPSDLRAKRGSAEPAVLAALQKLPDGVPTGDVVTQLGNDGQTIKYNTVRGTLYRMKEANKVRRMGDKWHLSPALRKSPPPKVGGGEK